MEKIVIENSELGFNETREIVGQRFSIEKNRFVMRLEEQVVFFSDIYQFQDDSIAYLKKDETVSGGRIDVVFNYMGLQDYDLIKVSTRAKVNVKRVALKSFCITSLNNEEHYGDVKFCKINEQKNLEESVISFTRLNNIHYLDNSVVLNYYEQIEKNGETKKIYNIALFDFEGKQKKSIIDCTVDDWINYKTEIKNDFLLIILIKRNKEKIINKLKIKDLTNF